MKLVSALQPKSLAQEGRTARAGYEGEVGGKIVANGIGACWTVSQGRPKRSVQKLSRAYRVFILSTQFSEDGPPGEVLTFLVAVPLK